MMSIRIDEIETGHVISYDLSDLDNNGVCNVKAITYSNPHAYYLFITMQTICKRIYDCGVLNSGKRIYST